MTDKKVYTEEEVERRVERLSFEKAMNTYSVAVNKMVKDMGIDRETKRLLNIDSETVSNWLRDPLKYRDNLINLSQLMFVTVPQYQQLIKYFSDQVILTPYIVPIKMITAKSKFKKEYDDCGFLLEKINVNSEYNKAVATAIREGVSFNYEIETDYSYTLKALNTKYCRVVGSEDSCWIYEFDFSYFDSKKLDGKPDITLLSTFPKEFEEKYNIYRSNPSKYKWQLLDTTKQVCIRYFPELNTPCMDFPPYCNLFGDFLDIMDYKALHKAKTEMENYRFIALVMQTASKDGEMNKFTVDPSMVMQYYDFLTDVCGDSITPFVSPVPVQELKFQSKASEQNEVANATKSAWEASGVSSTLFGTNATNAGTLKISNIVDQNRLNSLYSQVEAILTKKVKLLYNNGFKIKIPRVTTFNRQDVIDSALKSAQFGSPKMELFAMMGFTPAEINGLLLLENEILNLVDKLKPLQSSHTQNGNKEVGREAKDVTELTPSGENTQNNDNNSNKV